jgi:peptidylprolyl isomerase
MRRTAALTIAAVLTLGVAACGSEADDAATNATEVDAGADVTGAPGTDPLATTTSAATRPAPTECADAEPLDGANGAPTEVELPDVPPTDEVAVTVLAEGDGPEVTDASYVTVDYLGIGCTTGAVFDSSFDRGQPITAALGTAVPTDTAFQVIPGWTDGLVGQREGSLVQLDIPPALAYGELGSPPVIEANEPLTFVVAIREVSDTAP